MKGIVKFFSQVKSYGFIKGEDDKDYFVHSSQLGGQTIKEGNNVEFESKSTERGEQAIEVKVIAE